MKQQPRTERRRTICSVCDLVQVRIVAATLSPSVYFGECAKCGKSTMQRDVGGPIDEPSDQAPEPAPVPDGEPFEEGDPSVCPECQEVGRHDADCPFPGKLHQAYLRWRETEDGTAVVAAIRLRAKELRRLGFTHYGIQALAEVARFDRALSVGPDAAGYRVNNSHLSRLARDLMREPGLDGFFEVRELRSIR